MRRLVPLALAAALLAACGGARSTADEDALPALLDVWAGFEAAYDTLTRQHIPCDEAWGTWFEEWGVRGVACVAAYVAAPTEVIARAGVAPFVSGPHVATAEGFDLDLGAARAFGHYDPAFVRWVVENGAPEANAVTRPVYDRYLRRLARIYWLAYADMAADGFPQTAPPGILTGYAAFLDGAPAPEEAAYEGGFTVFAFTDLSEGLLPRLDVGMVNEWEAKYEANAAYGFWLRRRADGTVALWYDGLRRLLEAYDAGWLAGL